MGEVYRSGVCGRCTSRGLLLSTTIDLDTAAVTRGMIDPADECLLQHAYGLVWQLYQSWTIFMHWVEEAKSKLRL